MLASQTPRGRLLAALLLILLSLSLIAAAPARAWPETIALPDGFRPEGIAVGTGTTFYVGSIPTGAIYRGDLRTGAGDVLVEPAPGRAAIGLKYDERTGYLFVAGGPTGSAFVYDGDTGELIAAIELTDARPVFINDVAVTNEAAYFTNSAQQVFYRVALENDGSLPAAPVVEEIVLGGDFDFVPGAFNANGLAATPNGKTLIVVNSEVGALYRVDPQTGLADEIELSGGNVENGDGILLQGKTLYVVQNRDNRIAVVELSPDLGMGLIVETIASPLFDVPTTIARFGDSLYAVNARFTTPPTPTTPYNVVRVSRH